MKLEELLHTVEKGTKIKVIKGRNEILPSNAAPGDCEVRNIKNGIDCLVIEIL